MTASLGTNLSKNIWGQLRLLKEFHSDISRHHIEAIWISSSKQLHINSFLFGCEIEVRMACTKCYQ